MSSGDECSHREVLNFRCRSGAAGSQLNSCLCLCCCRGNHCDEDDSDYRGTGLEMVLSDHCEAEIHHDHRRAVHHHFDRPVGNCLCCRRLDYRRGCLHLGDLQQRDLCLGSCFDRRRLDYRRGCLHLGDLQQRDLCLGSRFDCRRLDYRRGCLHLRASSHHSDCTPCGRRNSNYCISDNASRHRGRFLSSRCGLRLDRRGRCFGIPHGRHPDRHDLFDRDLGHHHDLGHRHFDHRLLRASSHHNDCIRCGRRS